MTPLLRVVGLNVDYKTTLADSVFHAVVDASLEVHAGETVALVGESGSGKTSLARAVVRLVDPSAGQILLCVPPDAPQHAGEEVDLAPLSRTAVRPYRRHVQMVFQDPYASLDPRWPVGRSVREPMDALSVGTRRERRDRVAELLDRVGLPTETATRYPHELSGGQRQRIGIARALSTNPSLVILDEATAALDVSIQAQIINLLLELQRDLGLAYLFIAHDLAVVKAMAHHVHVMKDGRLVEHGETDELFATPTHPYTQGLLASVPTPEV